MVLEGETTNNFVLLALPTRVAPNIYNNSVANKKVNISNLINGKSYIYSTESMYYTYSYVDVSESKDEAQKILDNQKFIIDYYVNNHNGVYEETISQEQTEDGLKDVVIKTIKYQYLGNEFIINLYDNNFKMHYVGKVQ